MKSLENFIVKLKKDTEKSLEKEGKAKAAKHGTPYNGNSKLSASIKTSITGAAVSMSMNSYWHFVDGGRSPGGVSEKGQQSIASWIKRNGLNPSKIIDEMRAKSLGHQPKTKTSFVKAQKQFTYIVARKIKHKGYEGNDFYSNVINDGRVDKLNEEIGKEIKIDVINIFKNGGNTNK
jgi:hypothetical protein